MLKLKTNFVPESDTCLSTFTEAYWWAISVLAILHLPEKPFPCSHMMVVNKKPYTEYD